jgi:hypothetical protein
MVASFSTSGDEFRAETPRTWPEGRFAPRGPWRMFDLHPDVQRLGLRPGAGSVPLNHVAFVFSFFNDLKARVSTK